MTEQRPVRERLRELAARHEESQGPWPETGHVCLTCWQKWPCDAAKMWADLDTLERRADAERARTVVLETALRTLVDSVDRPAAPDSEWLEQAVIEARAALATPAEGAGE